MNSKFFLIQLFIIKAKFHIHACTFLKRKPDLSGILIEFKQYLPTIRPSTNQKTKRQYGIVDDLLC